MNENKALQIGYEYKGLRFVSSIIPWFADKVILEVAIRFPDKFICSAADFKLQLNPASSISATRLQINEGTGQKSGKVEFVLDNPRRVGKVRICFKKKLISEIEIPYLAKEFFISSVMIQSPELNCNFDGHVIACQSFLMSGCKGVSVSAILSTKYGLSFLSQLEVSLQIDVGSESPVTLISKVPPCDDSQSCVPVVFPLATLPKKIGNMKISFLVEGLKIGSIICQGISSSSFSKMIVVSRQSFVVWKKDGELSFVDELLELDDDSRFSPCFWLATKVDGLAGFADIKIQGYLHGSHQPLCFWEGKILVTSTADLMVPVNLGPESFKEVSYFEILSGKNSIGLIKLGSKPTVQFTSEGTIANSDVFGGPLNVSVQDVFKKLQQFSSSN